MYIQNTLEHSVGKNFQPEMNSFFHNTHKDKNYALQTQDKKSHNALEIYLKHFSNKAQLSFESLSATLPKQTKDELMQSLNSIGEAAAFSSMNGFESEQERSLVREYFENFKGVLDDELIKKMIFTKLKDPNIQDADFLKAFAFSLDGPMQRLDIKV